MRGAAAALRQPGGAVAAGGVELVLPDEQRPGQVGAAQVRVAQVRAQEVGTREVGAAQVGPDQQRSPVAGSCSRRTTSTNRPGATAGSSTP